MEKGRVERQAFSGSVASLSQLHSFLSSLSLLPIPTWEELARGIKVKPQEEDSTERDMKKLGHIFSWRSLQGMNFV